MPTSRGGAPTGDLSPADVELLDNGRSIPVVLISKPDVVSAGLLVDHDAVHLIGGGGAIDVVDTFLATLDPDDPALVASTEPVLRPQYTTDRGKLRTGLLMMPRGTDALALSDFLAAIVELAGAQRGAREVYVVSGRAKPTAPVPPTPLPWEVGPDPVTGQYNSPPSHYVPPKRPPKNTVPEVLRAAQRAAVAISVIVLAHSDFDSHLQSLATDSGGRFLTVDASSVGPTLSALVARRRTAVTVWFSPTSFDGKLHRLQVRSRRSDVTLDAPAAFYSPKSK